MSSKKNVLILWGVFFCYALCISLILQKLLLPLIPSLQAKGGLLPNDVTYFDSVAVTLSDQIRTHGWGSWKLFPANGVPGIVGILGALYFLVGYDPALILPLNASIHALSAVLIFLLIQELTDNKRAAIWSGLVVSSLFVVYPSALSWYGQIHKDTYSIAGMLLLLFIWVKTFNLGENLQNNKQFFWLVFGNTLGIFLILLVRPFLLKLLLVPAFIFLFILLLKSNKHALLKQYSFYFFLSVIFSLILSIASLNVLNKDGFIPSGEGYDKWIPTENFKLWKWDKSALMPDFAENYIETAAKTRVGLIEYGLSVNAKSMIDIADIPSSIGDVLMYIPRAFQISLFAPFPNTWLKEKSFTRIVTAMEMSIFYLFIPGLFFLVKYNRKPTVFLALFFASFFLLIYGFTQSNLGTLYRYRYAYFFIIYALSGLGWCLFLDKLGFLVRLEQIFKLNTCPSQNFNKVIIKKVAVGRKKVVNDSVFVMLFTLLSFLGFFIRDMMMAQTFGLGHALDSFYIALLIPMFFVTVVCIPLGSAFIPVFSEFVQQKKNSFQVDKLIASISGYSLIILTGICILIFLYFSGLVTDLNFINNKNKLYDISYLLNIGLLILLFSGFVIFGNAILTIKGHAIYSNSIQLIVPIMTIFTIYVFGSRYGVYSVIIAMLIGQILNLAFVQIKLKKYHVSLWPSLIKIDSKFTKSLLRQYIPLIASSFFVTAATTVDTMLAISLPEGAVSAFNLGNKAVLFIIGILSASMSSVILPYFSNLISSNKIAEAKHELSTFMIMLTLLSVPFTMIIVVWSVPITELIYAGGELGGGQILLVSRVMEYAVIQIPFFICSVLLLKFAIASKQTISVLVVTAIGLIINVVASYLLMQTMGVGGIALGSTISTIITTIVIILLLSMSGHIVGFDLLVVFLNWILYITLLVSVHFNSYAGVIIILITYLLLVSNYLKFVFLKKTKLTL